MVRVDLHVHSSASFDSSTPPEEVARRCRNLGLRPVVLTDHDSIAGALALHTTGVPTIVGEEVTTTEGELIGLFLTEAIPAGLSPDQAMDVIHTQGGLVYLQHPYDPRRRKLSETAIERLQDRIDIVEVFNGRANAEANRLAADLRDTIGAAAGAGSDAHQAGEIGAAYVELETFAGPQDFLSKLRQARIVTSPNRLRMRLQAALRTIQA